MCIYKQKTPQKNTNICNLICPIFCVWPHVLIHITPDIFSGKASWEESFDMPFHSWYCSAVISWHSAFIASWRDLWPCGHGQKPSISKLIKNSSMGMRKEEQGARKREIIIEWVSNHALTARGSNKDGRDVFLAVSWRWLRIELLGLSWASHSTRREHLMKKSVKVILCLFGMVQ